MKKTLYIFISLLVLSCGKDEDTTNEELVSNYEIDFTYLNASGDLSEQTSEQAKKIIYGKWDFGNSSKSSELGEKNNQATNSIFGKRYVRDNSKSSRPSKNLTCAFDFIEFNDNTYLMAIKSDGYSEYLSGDYVVNKNSNNKVTSVDLKFNLGLEEITIATLTDIIVVETGSKLDATFKISLNIPEDADFASCNSLSGSVSVDKDEPLEASSSATADTNHAKLIKTWNFDSYFSSENPDVNEIPLILKAASIEYDYTSNPDTNEDLIIETPIPNCSEPTNMSITFLTYGTYTFFFQGESDGILVEEVETWNWLNENQTEIILGGDDDYDANGDGVIDSLDADPYLKIQSITDDSLIMTIIYEAYIDADFTEYNSPAVTDTYTLSAR